jgi:hypothetical protein
MNLFGTSQRTTRKRRARLEASCDACELPTDRQDARLDRQDEHVLPEEVIGGLAAFRLFTRPSGGMAALPPGFRLPQ